MTFDLASPGGESYVCTAGPLSEEEKFDISVRQISVTSAEVYLKERRPPGRIIWQSFQMKEISLENV